MVNTLNTTRLLIDGTCFRDIHGRQVTLRGVNVAGTSKRPIIESQFSIPPQDFLDGDSVSFVGEPFSIEDAGSHFRRLQGWGYNTIRYVFTWEAIEHAGPRTYDEQWIQYTISILRVAKQYRFYVIMDPHQDVWSRFTGGSGAPMWTLYACGLNPEAFTATDAAIVCELQDNPSQLPHMIWNTNYARMACQVIFTMFWAGRAFCPLARIDGKNIQDYLQDHFVASCAHLAKRISEAGDLLDDPIIGWETMNEPSRGLIGHQDLSTHPTELGFRVGTNPTPWQAILTGSGRCLCIDEVALNSWRSFQAGRKIINPGNVSIWSMPSKYDDTKYGWKRDQSWKLGKCIWAQHGIWDPSSDDLLRKDYFSKDPHNGQKIDEEYFTNRFFMDHYRKFKCAVRKYHKSAIIFLQPPVLAVPPLVKDTQDDDPRMVYTPHFYDGLTLLNKSWNSWFNIDLFGVLRGQYLHYLFSLRFGETSIRNCLRQQLQAIRLEGEEKMGQHPCLLSEFGIPYDMDNKAAYSTKNYSKQVSAMDANHYALEGSGIAGYTVWCYNTHEIGDHWNGEDLSIFSLDDPALPNSPIGLKSEGTPYRAAEAYVRPSPVKVAGKIKAYEFLLTEATFFLTIDAKDISDVTKNGPPTEIQLPLYHFPTYYTIVNASSGTLSLIESDADGMRVLRWWHEGGLQTIEIGGKATKAAANWWWPIPSLF